MSANALLMKFQGHCLSSEDCEEIETLCRDDRSVPAGHDVISEGDRPDRIYLILRGWAARYKRVRNGSRQIVGLALPGDFCDLRATLLTSMDHSIVALSPLNIASISPMRLGRVRAAHPCIDQVLDWNTSVERNIMTEWVINIGRRDAKQRLAHLLCELTVRYAAIDLSPGDEARFPLGQDALADALGLTHVYLNRILAELKHQGAVTIGRGWIAVRDIEMISCIAGFDDGYLMPMPASNPQPARPLNF